MNKRIIVAAVASALMAGASVRLRRRSAALVDLGRRGEVRSAELKKMLEAKGPQVEGFCGRWWRRRCPR